MLIDEIVDFCDKKYSTYGAKCGCGTCNHPSHKCSGSCYNCLYEIHYPEKERVKNNTQKIIYDCPKMLYHYVCQYSFLYATEILYAFENEKEYLFDYPYFNIMSLGCGGCADLMGLEKFKSDNNLSQPISYIGFDINEGWKNINNKITRYCDSHSIKHKVHYDDVFKCFRQTGVKDTNIVVISYLISYLYNTKQISIIDSFLSDFANNVVMKKRTGEKFLLIINDLNTYKRGRTYFNDFIKKIDNLNLSILKKEYKYFDTGNLYNGQKIGSPYIYRGCDFTVPKVIKTKYHTDTNCKQTIQLILEVK